MPTVHSEITAASANCKTASADSEIYATCSVGKHEIRWHAQWTEATARWLTLRQETMRNILLINYDEVYRV